jgi:hypothetical protein
MRTSPSGPLEARPRTARVRGMRTFLVLDIESRQPWALNILVRVREIGRNSFSPRRKRVLWALAGALTRQTSRDTGRPMSSAHPHPTRPAPAKERRRRGPSAASLMLLVRAGPRHVMFSSANGVTTAAALL